MRLMRVIAVLFFSVIGGWVLAQASSEFNQEEFNQLALRAEAVAASEDASIEALETLRSTLIVQRGIALEAQGRRLSRIQSLEAQLEALGPVPENGIENEELALKRSDLTVQLEQARLPYAAAQNAYLRADGLVDELSAQMRAKSTSELFLRTESPLNVLLWPSALGSLGGFFADIGSEIRQNSSNATSIAVLQANTPVIAILALFGIALLGPGYFYASEAFTNSGAAKGRISTVTRLVLSLLVLFVPFIGFIALLRAIEETGFLGLRGQFLLDALPYAGAAIFSAIWIGRNLFFSGTAGSAFLGLDRQKEERAFRSILFAGVAIALDLIVTAIGEAGALNSDELAILRFPALVIGAVALLALSRKFRQYRIALIEQEDAPTATSTIIRLLSLICLIAGALGPIFAALGFNVIAAQLVFSTILSLGLLAAIVVLFSILVHFAERSDDEETNDADRRKEGLFRVILGASLLLGALPVLALVWGMRTSELRDIWQQLGEGFAVGDTRISFADVVSFAVIFFVGYTLTRLLQASLRSAVLPNTNLGTGAQNAVVTGFGYVGIFLAALIAIMSTGLDLSNLAIVAGALSVGIGFGLQAIVSNFVSGIILLIERPIEQGDWIEAGGFSGYVKDISVRSTTIETFDRSIVVMPNSELITGTVTNYTHSGKRGRVRVPVGVAYNSDPEKVKEVLLEIANDHPMVLKNPPANVMFMGFGADSMDFEIRAILRDVEYVLSVKSDMNYEIVKRFRDSGIDIPFAQREVRIVNADEMIPAVSKK